MFNKIIFCSLLISLCTSTFASVPGWPSNRIAMGTAVNGSETALTQLKERPVDSIFTYAGFNGAGDRGEFIAVDTKVQRIMNQTRDLEKQIGKIIQPVIVIYTVDGSDGVWAMQQDLDIDPKNPTQNLYLHYANLIRLAQLLESYKDAQHPVPATIILNPDFLGELHKQCGKWDCPIPLNQLIQVRAGLTKAFQYLTDHGYLKAPLTIPSIIPLNQAGLGDYVMSINWLIRTFAPSVSFGWQDNIWAGNGDTYSPEYPTAHLWIHDANQHPASIEAHATRETEFLQRMKVHQDPYKPDFIAFDKWERDVFDLTLNNAGLNNGYLYNSKDWDVYMKFVSKVSQNFGNMPIMLWQIPGGHLQTKNDIDNRNDHGSTAPDYFLGDTNLDSQLKNVAGYISISTLNPASYFVTSKSVVDYLKCPESDAKCWHKNRLPELAKMNVFAILWGGGSTTGIVGITDNLNDNGWLYQKLKASQ